MKWAIPSILGARIGSLNTNPTSNWNFFKTITIDQPGSDLTNFPLLFLGTYSYLKTQANGGNVNNSNGYDIAFFSDSSLTTMLKFERVYWDATTGDVEFWVKIPLLSSSSSTIIYIAYGNSTISTDQQDLVNTWGTNAKTIFHCQDNNASPTVIDSTSNGNGLCTTNTNNLSSTGKIKNSFNFTAANSERIDIGTSPIIGSGNFSCSSWIKTSDSGNRKGILEWGPILADNDGFTLYKGTDNKLHSDNTNIAGPLSSTTINDDNWHLVHLVNNGGTYQLYIDGLPNGSSVSMSPNFEIGAYNIFGAQFYSAAYRDYWNGDLDEGRIWNIALSSDWIAAEYSNQNDPANFYIVS